MANKRYKKLEVYYTIGGALFGFLFPFMAIAIDLYIHDSSISIYNIIEVHKINPIHFIIDSAPFVISFVAFLIAQDITKRAKKSREQIEKQANILEKTNKELEKLSIVARETDNAVIIMDKDGNFEWVNYAYTARYGFSEEEHINKNITEISGNIDITELFLECVKLKTAVFYEALVISKNGEKIWSQTTLNPIINETNEIEKLVAIDTDVTRQKKAEEAIKQQNEEILAQALELQNTNEELEKLSIVARETDNAILITDAEGNFEWVNESYTRIFGYTYDQLVSEISNNIIGNKTNDRVRDKINLCLENKQTVNYEFSTFNKDKKKIWIQTTLTPIIGEDGEISKLVAIDSDITKVKEAELEIRKHQKEVEEKNERIEFQNKQIKASIHYAKSIQEAIFPIKQNMDKYFDSFLLFKAKDVVSGDFYWYSNVFTYDVFSQVTLVAVIDCTGHGVPGAFMSMIGTRILNGIINIKKVYQPKVILNLLDIRLRKALKQDQTNNNDGMDVCLCALEKIDSRKTKVTFAGAKSPLYYVRKDSNEVDKIKGSRKRIGGTISKNTSKIDFTQHEIILRKGDMMYLSTDGFIDQNNPIRKRFGSKRFIELLSSVSNQPLDMQKEKLNNVLIEYQQGEAQRDDITIMGIKI